MKNLKFKEGMAPYRENGLWGFIDKSVTKKIKAIYSEVGEFSEGVASVVKSFDSKKMIGFIDTEGKKVIDFKFLFIENTSLPKFRNGYAIVINQKGERRFIDKDGLTPSSLSQFRPKYNFSNEGISFGNIKKKKGDIINNNGKVLDRKTIILNTNNFSEGIYVSKRTNFLGNRYYSYNIFNLKKNRIQDAFSTFSGFDNVFSKINNFNDGISTATKKQISGKPPETIYILDTNGNQIGSKTDWKNCGSHSCGYIRVNSLIQNSKAVNYYNPYKQNYLFKSHKDIEKERYYDFSDDFALVKKKNGPFGFIDLDGNEAIDFLYEKGTDFSEGYACMFLNNEYIYIDKNGKDRFKFK